MMIRIVTFLFLLLCSIAFPKVCSKAVSVQVSRSGKRILTSTSLPDKTLDVRGGNSALANAENTLLHHIQQQETTTTSKGEGKFHVQGWRWHTMSLMREAERLQKLAKHCLNAQSHHHNQQEGQQQQQESLQKLQKGVDYVIGFNLGALHRVEGMFFPWMRKKMNKYNTDDPQTNKAFETIMDHLEKEQKHLAKIGNQIVSQVVVLLVFIACFLSNNGVHLTFFILSIYINFHVCPSPILPDKDFGNL